MIARRAVACATPVRWNCVAVTPAVYRVVVEGQLGPRYETLFEGMRLEQVGEQTVIVGTVTDQSHLQGLLERIARMGLELVSVVREPGPQPQVNGTEH